MVSNDADAHEVVVSDNFHGMPCANRILKFLDFRAGQHCSTKRPGVLRSVNRQA